MRDFIGNSSINQRKLANVHVLFQGLHQFLEQLVRDVQDVVQIDHCQIIFVLPAAAEIKYLKNLIFEKFFFHFIDFF